MALTQKRQEELYDQMAQRQGQRVREMLEPPSLASKIWPRLPRSADDQPKQSPVQGWGQRNEMVEVRLRDLKPESQRIADRLKGSNDTSTANTISKHGDGPTRTVTSVHHGGHQHQHGSVNSGEANIIGGKR
jgi:hypothetical protein